MGVGPGHPLPAGEPENLVPHSLTPYRRCLVLLVIFSCGRAFPALPASTPSVPASCPPSAPTATAKVTDDLLIARSDRHLGVLISVVFPMASEETDAARLLAYLLSWSWLP